MKLKDKVQHALDESRILILGIQVLLGFDFQAFFMRAFDKLPAAAHSLKLVGLVLLGAAMILVFAPVARHRIVDHGKDTPNLHRFTRRATALALAPFSLALGIDFFVVGCRLRGPIFAAIAGVTASTAALVAWYALPLLFRRTSQHPEDEMDQTKLNDKVRQVLTEARVVLPGTQTLLGFQLAAVLQQGFETLPSASKVVHLVGLFFLGASVILLMVPAAFHRIAENGEISERLHGVSSASILGAMATLAVGLGSAAFVVVEKATGSFSAATIASASWLAASFGVWFGLMFGIRVAAKSRPLSHETTEWQVDQLL